MPISIMVADDHVIIREGMERIFKSDREFRVIGLASNGREAVELAAELKPDIVLMDVSMPMLNGIEATQMILKANPNTKVLGLSMHYDRRFIVQMMRAGASGYILKHAELDELRTALRSVMNGKIFFGYGAREVLTGSSPDDVGSSSSGIISILSPREREVLQMIAEGLNTKKIASQLGVKPKTVDTIRLRLMNKLDIYSVAELTKFALREGITDLNL